MSASTGPAGQATTGVARWDIDGVHSEIEFSVRHMMIASVKGRFTKFEGHIDFDPSNPTSGLVDVVIDARSVNTRNEYRDNHLRSADFFDAENHPEIRFVSKRVEPVGGDDYKIVGDLTLRGNTHEVTLDTTFEGIITQQGATRAGFSASTTINRFDFGLAWNNTLESGGLVAGDKIKITLEIEAVRQD